MTGTYISNKWQRTERAAVPNSDSPLRVKNSSKQTNVMLT